MTRYLAGTRAAVIADLASNGFVFRDENGDTHIPEAFEMTTANGHCAIYLGKAPISNAVLDEDGNVLTPAVYSTQFCANTTDPDSVFATEIDPPTIPYNVFA